MEHIGFNLGVSPDSLTVTLEISAGAEVSAGTIITALRDLKLTTFDDGLVIEMVEKCKDTSLSAVVAAGVPAVDERPARVEYRIPIPDLASFTVAKVEAGQVIANLTPAIAGVDGRNVFGKPIAHRKDERPLQTGRGLTFVKGGIVTTSRGNLQLKGNVLSVEPLLELRDKDANAVPINFDGDATAKGSISEGSVLQFSGSLNVGGAIEAIQLKAGGSVNVKGGIIGKQRGKFVIGGDLRCRFISGGLIIVGGDVLVQSEIIHGRITCTGRLSVVHGPIYGGVVAANGGISCQVLGHANGAPTIIESGQGTACRSFIASTEAQIEANRKRVRAVRVKIAPLLQQGKNLNAKQKEKATELLYEAGELEAQTDKMVQCLDDQVRLFRDKARAEILVNGVALAGVTIRLSGLETTLPSAFKGPFTLTTRKSGSLSEIVLIDGTDRSVTGLPSHAVTTENSSCRVEPFSRNAA